MFKWFKKKSTSALGQNLTVDMHSHLLPGLDDGVKTFEQAEEIILFLKSLGYKKLITTPHIMSDAFRNTPQGIAEKLSELRQYLLDKSIDVEIEAAAEYYLDEDLMKAVQTDRALLTFGQRYLLFETNFMTEPFNLREFIFIAHTKGYKLILAHPERYLYLQNDFSKAQDLLDRGVLFQVNISSLTGHYSKPAKRTADLLIEKGHVHLLGTDCHHMQHAHLIEHAQKLKSYQKALTLPLLNNSL